MLFSAFSAIDCAAAKIYFLSADPSSSGGVPTAIKHTSVSLSADFKSRVK